MWRCRSGCIEAVVKVIGEVHQEGMDMWWFICSEQMSGVAAQIFLPSLVFPGPGLDVWERTYPISRGLCPRKIILAFSGVLYVLARAMTFRVPRQGWIARRMGAVNRGAVAVSIVRYSLNTKGR